ncbi:potassium channel family protein [Actinokineospora iranica]|uniref:Voltage-gated potassium channel n=1 Tax=Actinokineospora iranica TaxID=1271860 RepID=A0A1G6Q918_9PSEU|nr:potassium channel family protein [Actinokineospora iranica]SDC88404.1 voltage-gated potassium channel [Actinokineospora iranica]
MSDIPAPGERRADPLEPRLSAWEARTDLPLTGLAVAFLVAYAWQVLDAGASPGLGFWLEVWLWVVWGVFAVDYVTRLALARHKWRFVGRHLFDLVVVALPMVRQLRALRLITVFRVLNQRMDTSFRGKTGVYVGGTTLLVGLCASLAVLDAERHAPDASITTFGDALWWTLTTISTVGYGDHYPVTVEGRLVAGALMLGGIALLGVVTGVIASWFVEKIAGAEQSIEDTTRAEVRLLREELAQLRAELLTRERAELDSPAPDSPQR